jgi:hypothetical protein
MRLGVDRRALLGEIAQNDERLAILEQRPGVAAGDALASVSRSASIHTATHRSRISARVCGFTNAPPPVAITFGAPLIRRAITRRSPSRKFSSPKRAQISPTL